MQNSLEKYLTDPEYIRKAIRNFTRLTLKELKTADPKKSEWIIKEQITTEGLDAKKAESMNYLEICCLIAQVDWNEAYSGDYSDASQKEYSNHDNFLYHTRALLRTLQCGKKTNTAVRIFFALPLKEFYETMEQERNSKELMRQYQMLKEQYLALYEFINGEADQQTFLDGKTVRDVLDLCWKILNTCWAPTVTEPEYYIRSIRDSLELAALVLIKSFYCVYRERFRPEDVTDRYRTDFFDMYLSGRDAHSGASACGISSGNDLVCRAVAGFSADRMDEGINYLEEVCTERAKELYGELLPGWLSERIGRELEYIRKANLAEDLACVHKKLNALPSSGKRHWNLGFQGMTGAMFILYLCGLTPIDPACISGLDRDFTVDFYFEEYLRESESERACIRLEAGKDTEELLLQAGIGDCRRVQVSESVSLTLIDRLEEATGDCFWTENPEADYGNLRLLRFLNQKTIEGPGLLSLLPFFRENAAAVAYVQDPLQLGTVNDFLLLMGHLLGDGSWAYLTKERHLTCMEDIFDRLYGWVKDSFLTKREQAYVYGEEARARAICRKLRDWYVIPDKDLFMELEGSDSPEDGNDPEAREDADGPDSPEVGDTPDYWREIKRICREITGRIIRNELTGRDEELLLSGAFRAEELSKLEKIHVFPCRAECIAKAMEIKRLVYYYNFHRDVYMELFRQLYP